MNLRKIERNYLEKNVIDGIDQMLKTATKRNFSKYAYGIEELRGKTGTTNDIRDLWYIGYNDNFTVGIWMGFDNQAISFKESNGSIVKVYKEIFNIVEANYKK